MYIYFWCTDSTSCDGSQSAILSNACAGLEHGGLLGTRCAARHIYGRRSPGCDFSEGLRHPEASGTARGNSAWQAGKAARAGEFSVPGAAMRAATSGTLFLHASTTTTIFVLPPVVYFPHRPCLIPLSDDTRGRARHQWRSSLESKRLGRECQYVADCSS